MRHVSGIADWSRDSTLATSKVAISDMCIAVPQLPAHYCSSREQTLRTSSNSSRSGCCFDMQYARYIGHSPHHVYVCSKVSVSFARMTHNREPSNTSRSASGPATANSSSGVHENTSIATMYTIKRRLQSR
eukprot:GHUV01021774.1.p1 GENE.GHUV01021774.1~~GHUV01021774.1.p1  ORF type:complete len:131 (+),score=14.23 GHUV01021774.1:389-781(+)